MILNTNFIKQQSKSDYSSVSNWNPPDWEPKVVTITLGSTYSVMESFELLHTHLQILETLHFP